MQFGRDPAGERLLRVELERGIDRCLRLLIIAPLERQPGKFGQTASAFSPPSLQSAALTASSYSPRSAWHRASPSAAAGVFLGQRREHLRRLLIPPGHERLLAPHPAPPALPRWQREAKTTINKSEEIARMMNGKVIGPWYLGLEAGLDLGRLHTIRPNV